MSTGSFIGKIFYCIKYTNMSTGKFPGKKIKC